MLALVWTGLDWTPDQYSNLRLEAMSNGWWTRAGPNPLQLPCKAKDKKKDDPDQNRFFIFIFIFILGGSLPPYNRHHLPRSITPTSSPCRLLFRYRISKIPDPRDSWTDLCEKLYFCKVILITLEVESSDTIDDPKENI
jgi:hypothetical protein